MAHVIERAIGAGIAGAQNLVLGQVSKSIAGSMGMTQEHEFDTLLAVIQYQLVVENQVGYFQEAVGDILAACGSLAGLQELFRTVDAQEPGTIRLGHDARARFGEDGVAISMVAVMVR